MSVCGGAERVSAAVPVWKSCLFLTCGHVEMYYLFIPVAGMGQCLGVLGQVDEVKLA